MSKYIVIEEFYKFLVYWIFLILLFGYFDYFFLGEKFWKEIVFYGDYISEIKGFKETLIDFLPGNFYFDPYVLKIRRFVGTMGDPLAFSYFGSIVLVIIMFEKININKYILAIVKILLVAAIALSLTRAIIISLIIVLIIHKIFKRHSLLVIVFLVFFTTFFLFIISSLDLSSLDSSFKGHLLSFVKFVKFIDLNSLILLSIGKDNINIFEPAFYNIFCLFGLYGALFFFILYYKLYCIISKVNISCEVMLLIVFFVSSLFSQSFFSTSSSWLLWFMIGYKTTLYIRGTNE